MFQHSLSLRSVSLPEHPLDWPAPLNLDLGLREVLLIEGASLTESEALLRVAATLTAPVEGQVWHWGKETTGLPREELYLLRRQIAYVSPRQVLLHRLTLLDNIALGPIYHQGWSQTEVRRRHAPLLEALGLEPYLSHYPPQVPEAVYFRALWARELVKGPALILASLMGPLQYLKTQEMVVLWLEHYLKEPESALLLLGRTLTTFHPLAHRILKLEAGHLVELHFSGSQERPLTAFLPLV